MNSDVTICDATPVAASESFDNFHQGANLAAAPVWPAHPAWMRAFLQMRGAPLGVGE